MRVLYTVHHTAASQRMLRNDHIPTFHWPEKMIFAPAVFRAQRETELRVITQSYSTVVVTRRLTNWLFVTRGVESTKHGFRHCCYDDKLGSFSPSSSSSSSPSSPSSFFFMLLYTTTTIQSWAKISGEQLWKTARCWFWFANTDKIVYVHDIDTQSSKWRDNPVVRVFDQRPFPLRTLHLSHISSLMLAWCKEGTVSQVLSYWSVA